MTPYSRKRGEDSLEIVSGGVLGNQSLTAFTDLLKQALDEGRHVLLDLGDCEAITPQTLAAVATAGASFTARGLELYFFGAKEPLRRMLQAALEVDAGRPLSAAGRHRRLSRRGSSPRLS